MIADVKQVTLYMRDEALRGEIQTRVRDAIGPDTKVVVAHSLGSVVAYEVLAVPSADLGVTTLVTLGSPLGIRNVIFDRLTPRPENGQGAWPPSLDRWHNVADPGDIVAMVKELSPLFGGGVTDWLVHNGAKAHDARPYLTAEETGACRSLPALSADGVPRYLIASGTRITWTLTSGWGRFLTSFRRITELFAKYGFEETLTQLRLDRPVTPSG